MEFRLILLIFAGLIRSIHPDQTKLNLDTPISGLQNTYRATGVKRILIDVGRPLLPKDFDLQPKRGFAMPFDIWLKNPLKEIFLDTLSESSVRRRGWFNVNSVTNVKNNFLEGSSHWSQPWMLMMTELWASQVLDCAGGY